jgi:hypothetical protein
LEETSVNLNQGLKEVVWIGKISKAGYGVFCHEIIALDNSVNGA